MQYRIHPVGALRLLTLVLLASPALAADEAPTPGAATPPPAAEIQAPPSDAAASGAATPPAEAAAASASTDSSTAAAPLPAASGASATASGAAMSGATVPSPAAEPVAEAAPFANTDDVPMVLAATRLRQSLLEVPAAVTIIDRPMIEQSGAREIPELLRLVPGMVVAYDQGSEAFVSFHGTSADLARRMQVKVDGRSIYQPMLAAVDWLGLPLDLADIERIEVVRGPSSAAWGANSFLAVVNIVTRHPGDVERGRISYHTGEDGIEDFLARLAQRNGNVDWRLTFSGRNDDGFKYNSKFHSDFTDSKDIDSAYGRMIWTPAEGSSLELSLGHSRMMAQEQYRATYFTRTPVAERDNDFLSLTWEQDLTDSNQLRLQASESHFQRDEPWFVKVPPVAFLPEAGQLFKQNRKCANGLFAKKTDISSCRKVAAPGEQYSDMQLVGQISTAMKADPALTKDAAFRSGLDADEHRTEVELQDTWMFSQNLRTVFGATYDQARVDSQVYLKGHEENTVWRLFAHSEWRFAPRWLLNVGGNQEFDEGAGNYFSPRYALNWQMTDTQTLRAVYSEAVRTPDILEEQADFGYVATMNDPSLLTGPNAKTKRDDRTLFSSPVVFYQTGQGNGQAPTERIASSELGYVGRFPVPRITVDMRVFHDKMRLAEHNLDPTDSDGFLIRPTKPVIINGFELGSDWRPLPSQRFQLNYAYLDMDKATPDDDNATFVPQHSGSVGWWQDYGIGVQFGTTYVFYNDLRPDNGMFFDRLDNRVAKTFPLGGQARATLAAVVQTRLTDDPELRGENHSERNRGWFSLDLIY